MIRIANGMGIVACVAWPWIGLLWGVPPAILSWCMSLMLAGCLLGTLLWVRPHLPRARRAVRQAGTGYELRGGNTPLRLPRYGFGARLRDPHGFLGDVDAIYADYWSAVESLAVPPDWFEIQFIPPSTRDQVFYGIIAPDGKPGASLVGEEEAQYVGPTRASV